MIKSLNQTATSSTPVLECELGKKLEKLALCVVNLDTTVMQLEGIVEAFSPHAPGSLCSGACGYEDSMYGRIDRLCDAIGDLDLRIAVATKRL